MDAENTDNHNNHLQELVAAYDDAFDKSLTLFQIVKTEFPSGKVTNRSIEVRRQLGDAYAARREAVLALAKQGTEEAYNVLIELLAQPKYDGAKSDIIFALIEIGNAQIVDILLDILKTERKDSDLLHLVISELSNFQERRAVEPILELLEELGYLDEEARRAEEELDKKWFTHFIMRRKSKYYDKQFLVYRPYILPLALGEIGDARAVDPLIRLLEIGTKNGEVEGDAIIALGLLGNKKAIPVLTKYLGKTTYISHWGCRDNHPCHEAAKEAIQKFEALLTSGLLY